MNKGRSKGKKKAAGHVFIFSGLVLLLVVSLLDGFVSAFTHAIQHIIFDLTIDVKVHAYIAGIVLLMYGLYKRARS